MPVLDAHTHIFPPELIRNRDRIASRESGFSLLYGQPRAKMADGTGLFSYMEEEGVDRAAVTGFPFEDSGLIRLANDYVLEVARSDKRVLPFVMVDRRDEAAALTEADRCFEKGARGVGELAYYLGGFGKSERMGLEGLARYLEQKGMVLMLHLNEQVGHLYAGKTQADFAEVASFVQSHPALKMILAHMGGGICFYELMPEIRSAFSNVYYDLAAAPFLYSKDLYAFADRFLTRKVLFGSDYPLLTLARYKPDLEGLDEEARQRLLYDNGRQLLGA